MNLAQLLDSLRADPAFMRNVSRWEVLPPRPPRYAPFPARLDPRLVARCRARGIAQLYTHQAAAVDLALDGRSVVVATPTASGKTLCYNLPVFDTILREPQARALYLFPDQGARQDQMHEVHELVAALGVDIKVHTFDGDTPETARRAIRSSGHIVVTNPDMLHAGILPHHTQWVKLFENLRYVVIDEVHQYRGVFGSHVANVLRRLKRIARFYGAEPAVHLLLRHHRQPRRARRRADRRGRGRGGRQRRAAGREALHLLQPAGGQRGARHPALARSRRPAAIAERFLQAGAQTIVFARSRTRVEVLLTYLQRRWPQGRHPQRRGARLPRRLPAQRAARDRAGAARRRRSAAWSPPTRSSWASTSARSTCA